MNEKLTIPGRIVSGAKKGAFFTQLEWVREQCLEKLGFAPWPGTLNLEIPIDRVPMIERLVVEEGFELVSPDENYCSGHVIPVSVDGIAGAIVFPADNVRVHTKNVVEIISPEMLKDILDVQDGDSVMITINKD